MTDEKANVDIFVEPRSNDYEASDRRWLEALDAFKRELKSALREEEGELIERESVVEGYKGGIVELTLALGTSGAISAAVMAFKAWLENGRNREIVIKRREGNKVTEISVKTIGISEKRLVEQMEAALAKPKSP